MYVSLPALYIQGCRAMQAKRQIARELQNIWIGESTWKVRAKEGDSPVVEIHISLAWYLSTAGPVESRRNLGGPSSKAKYYLATDSEQVP